MIFPDLHTLTSQVGNSRHNDEKDVEQTKLNLARLGYYNEPIHNGVIDAGLDKAINDFQSNNNLKQDGWMQPGGETETTIKDQITKLREQAMNQLNDSVDYKDKIKEYDFDEKGEGELGFFLKNPLKAWNIDREAKEITNKTILDLFPNIKNKRDNEADAFRHTLWSYQLTKKYGADEAKRVTDAHERSLEDKEGARLMDLHNNAFGRLLAQDKNNDALKDIEVVKKALKDGNLRISPFRLKEDQIPFHIPNLENTDPYY